MSKRGFQELESGLRHANLTSKGAGLTLIGSWFDADTRRILELLRNPGNRALLDALGLTDSHETGPSSTCDLLVLRGGPAGLSEPPSLFLETRRAGIFCVGDVRSGSVKRVAAAIGEGAMAVRLVFDRLEASGIATAPSPQAAPPGTAS